MNYDFNRIIERKGTDSWKWGTCPEGVIPMWLADMDFLSAEPILRALHQRVDHGIFGYPIALPSMRAVIQERLKNLYRWTVKEEEILLLPGLVTGLNIAFQAYAGPGDEILVQPPVYHHFLKDVVHHGRRLNDPPLVKKGDTYEVDFDAFEKAITERTRLFVLCNPHNPVGRVYTRKELEQMAEICLRHDVILCSDEIHCDLIYPGHRHVPIATLGSDVADRTVTLMAPSKTYNLAGLACGFAIIKNRRLKRAWQTVSQGLVFGLNIMGQTAAVAAFSEGQEWLDQVILYLRDNRDFLHGFLRERMPGIEMCRMEATYLAWLNCREAELPGNPAEFFLKEARVAMSPGPDFGRGGEGFIRLNFACPRKTLTEALERMAAALHRL